MVSGRSHQPQPVLLPQLLQGEHAPGRCIIPPHWLQAGPRSNPIMRAGCTGGESVSASAAARRSPGWEPATVGMPGSEPWTAGSAGLVGAWAPPLPFPFVDPAVADVAGVAA